LYLVLLMKMLGRSGKKLKLVQIIIERRKINGARL